MSKEEQLIAILKIVNESPYKWLHIDSNEAKEIRTILNDEPINNENPHDSKPDINHIY